VESCSGKKPKKCLKKFSHIAEQCESLTKTAEKDAQALQSVSL
jgi:hypothetical protein